jgi:hypothetical protein
MRSSFSDHSLIWHVKAAGLSDSSQNVVVKMNQLGVTSWKQIMLMNLREFGMFIGLLCLNIDDARAIGKFRTECKLGMHHYREELLSSVDFAVQKSQPNEEDTDTLPSATEGNEANNQVSARSNRVNKRGLTALTPQPSAPVAEEPTDAPQNESQRSTMAPPSDNPTQSSDGMEHLKVRKNRRSGRRSAQSNRGNKSMPSPLHESRHLSRTRGWIHACTMRSKGIKHEAQSFALSEWDGSWHFSHIVRRVGGAVLVVRSAPFTAIEQHKDDDTVASHEVRMNINNSAYDMFSNID